MKGIRFKQPPKKIIIRMPNWIGDLVMATPILTDVRKRFPGSEITAMCHEKLAPLLEHDPDIDELFAYSKPSGWEKKDESRSITGKLRKGKYDLGILLTNSISSAAWFCFGGVRYRLGFRGDWRLPFLTRGVPRVKEPIHQVNVYKKLLEPLGIQHSNTKPRLHLLPSELEAAEEMLQRQGVPKKRTLIGVNPGAAYGSAKCWPPDRFKEVIGKLIQDSDTYVILFGDAAGAPTVKTICSGLPERVINLAGATSLRELSCLIKLSDVMLTNDSGPMHIAAAVETPLVALFGSTSSDKTGPYGQGTVIHKNVECSPCYLRECPIDFRCMTRITPDEVFAEVDKLANRK